MPLPGTTYVQSLAPGGAKPVATTTFPTADATSAAVQWILVTDANTPIGATVRSYASANPIAVALTDVTGKHFAGPNTAIATSRITVSASGTALPASPLTNRVTVLLYNRGNLANPTSSALVWVGAVGVGSSGGWPLEAGGTLNLTAGATIALYGATNGSSQGNSVNSGQEVTVLELA